MDIYSSKCWRLAYEGGGGYSHILAIRVSTRFFYKNNFIKTTRLKFAKKLRTTLEQSRLGFGNINAKFAFFNKILLFFSKSSNSTVSRALKYSKC